MKKTLAIFCSIGLLAAQAQALDFSNSRGKVTLNSIRHNLEKVDKRQTCLDEYMKRDRSLVLRTGLGTGLGLPAAGAGIIGGAIVAAPLLFVGAGSLVIATAVTGGAVVGIPLGLLSGVSAIQLGQNRYVMRLVAQSYEGEGKRLDWFHKRIKNKYRRKFGKRIDDLSKQELASKIVRLDRSGALCDGTLTGKSGKLKKRLARPKHLRKYLYKNL